LIQEKESEQHGHAANHSEKEKIEGGTVTVFAVTKHFYQEESWDERKFPIEKPVEKVERGEDAKESSELYGEQRKVGAGPILVFP
jgi:hypothetical protein